MKISTLKLQREIKKARRRTVIFSQNEDDFRVAFLASFAQSTRLISKLTGFTPSQIAYRLRRSGIRRMDFRDGKSKIAQLVMNKFHNQATSILQPILNRVDREDDYKPKWNAGKNGKLLNH